MIGGMSSASMSAASAYVSDISTPENRAKSFGMVIAWFYFKGHGKLTAKAAG